MYTLVNAEGKGLCWVTCMPCSLAAQDGAMVMPSDCDYCASHHSNLHLQSLPYNFQAVFSADGLVAKCCQELWYKEFYVATTTCDTIYHADSAVGHVRCQDWINTNHIVKYDVEFLICELMPKVDLARHYDRLMSQAIQNNALDLCHELQSACPDLQLSVESKSKLYELANGTPERQQILHLMAQYGLVSDIEALAYALLWRLDYDVYLSRVDIYHAEEYVHHDLMLALNISQRPETEALEIFHQLQHQGLVVVSDSGIITQKRPVLFRIAEYIVPCLVAYREILCEISALGPDVVDWDSACEFFTVCFPASATADWSFFPEDIAINCVLDLARMCRHSGCEWFQLYLRRYFADMDALREVFMQLYTKHPTATMCLVDVLPDGIVPDAWAQAASMAFGYDDSADYFSADYILFLEHQMGIFPDVEWYLKAFFASKLNCSTMIWLLTTRQATRQLDWQHRCVLRANSVLARSPKHTACSLMEFMFFQHAAIIDVPVLAQDIGLELDFDVMREILDSIVGVHKDGGTYHKVCRYVELAVRSEIYSAIRLLYRMRPDMADMVEIWHAVRNFWGKSKTHMIWKSKYYHTICVSPFSHRPRVNYIQLVADYGNNCCIAKN